MKIVSDARANETFIVQAHLMKVTYDRQSIFIVQAIGEMVHYQKVNHQNVNFQNYVLVDIFYDHVLVDFSYDEEMVDFL